MIKVFFPKIPIWHILYSFHPFVSLISIPSAISILSYCSIFNCNIEEYRRITDIKNLYDYIDQNYYKPIKINNAFNDDYMEYESNGDKQYCNVIRQYLSNIINNHKDEWKIQLTMKISFIPSIDPEDSKKTTHIMPAKRDNMEITISNDTDEIIKELLNHL